MIRLDGSIRKVSGSISVNGDKSITHRSIMFGSIAKGKTIVRGYLQSEDCESTKNAFKMMGVSFEKKDSDLYIMGCGARGLKEPEDVIDLGNSGTSLRLLTGLNAAQPFFSVLTGDSSLVQRPMKRILDPLSTMGADIWGKKDGKFAPFAIRGKSLSPANYTLPVASAQVKSAIMLASLYIDGESRICEPVPSRDHTERMINYFGGKCDKKGNDIVLPGTQLLEGRKITVAGDISSAAYFIVAALISKGSMLEIKGVNLNPTRTGIIDILRDMGGRIEIENERIESGEPVGDLIVFASDLKGTVIEKNVIPRAIDELPVITIAAALAEGKTVIKDARELRVKESDRIYSMGTELGRLGVELTMKDDGMIIHGTETFKGAECKSYGDHRVVMSLAIAALRTRGDIDIDNVKSVNTSFPDFFTILSSVGSR